MATLMELIEQLKAQAGPRGATYLGRVLQPGDTVQSVMGRIPMAEMETGGMTMGATQTAMDLFRRRLLSGMNRFPNIDPRFEAILQREINLGPAVNPHRKALSAAEAEFFERFYPHGAGMK